MLAEHGKLHRKDYKDVHAIENAHKNTKEISTWISNVEKIQKDRYAPSVVYSNRMPEINSLMEVSFNFKLNRLGLLKWKKL